MLHHPSWGKTDENSQQTWYLWDSCWHVILCPRVTAHSSQTPKQIDRWLPSWGWSVNRHEESEEQTTSQTAFALTITVQARSFLYLKGNAFPVHKSIDQCSNSAGNWETPHYTRISRPRLTHWRVTTRALNNRHILSSSGQDKGGMFSRLLMGP